MILGIFADSYGDRCPNPGTNNTQSWPELLQTMGHTVKNHSRTGMDLWYCYQRFLQHHEHCDRVIFLATAYHRQPVRGMMITTVNVNHLQYYRDRSTNDYHRRALTAARDYVLWAQDPEYSRGMSELIIDSVSTLRPDALIMPCFSPLEGSAYSSMTSTTSAEDRSPRIPGWQGASLWSISDIDHQHWHIKPLQIENDRRHCHFNEANNEQFAAEIDQWLVKGLQPLQDLTAYRPSRRQVTDFFDLKG